MSGVSGQGERSASSAGATKRLSERRPSAGYLAGVVATALVALSGRRWRSLRVLPRPPTDPRARAWA